ncbi:DNA helicase RecQ [Clostridium formicaceticum]|uniref:DNA helicase RecQ n=1 Tax=Clostridium formicaceticum TaxID=1497 RepID=A0AAC9RJ39_9CLOT|nr:DNA helicase RecQ [Clostridium formicaceticum]AOY76592.1 ATP-dependent DNA helicase RecQ [Clostridium formicaceticum]ARE87011.1 ATP-dependent DNA helicase RecQ [Clostridium formicaceticum]
MDIYRQLKTYFGYDRFKKGQEKLIAGILKGIDVLGIMPTGGGKSLCYQLPAVTLEGVTIVVSPLISLMKDQVDALYEMGIKAACINSTLQTSELIEITKEIKANQYKIVFVAPERLNSSSFMDMIKHIKISLVAIDEAHCISQWGHDFRPSYLEIPRFIGRFRNRPVVAAFTATATKEIIAEIKALIGLQDPLEVTTGFDRPNLFYQVTKAGNKFAYLCDYLENNFQEESGIIYCSTRKTVEALVKKLKERGISINGYHGGMQTELRQKNQEDFMFNRVRIIVATNAFGMGIDKPDVRFVIHYNMPKNMEAYYQEAGRGGRDGEESHCILMYSPSDVVKQKLMIANEEIAPEREALQYKNLQYLIDFCHTNDCLRNKILSYFGEEVISDNCGKCSNCLDQSEMVDITVESQKVLSCIYRVNQKYGVNTVIQVLRGSKNRRILEQGLNQVSTYNIMKDYSEKAIREIIMTLSAREYIHITTDKFPVLKLTSKCREVLQGKVKVYHKKDLIENKPSENKKEGLDKRAMDDAFDEELLRKLKELRYTIAAEHELPPFMIFHDRTLKEMASCFPQDKEAFLKINGVGEKKFENYGEKFILLIKDYCIDKKIDTALEENELDQEAAYDRYQLTYHWYLEELSIEKIADKRTLKPATIIQHLKRCQENGLVVDWERFMCDAEKEKVVMEAVKKIGSQRLKPIKDALPEDISYEDIRIVIIKNAL